MRIKYVMTDKGPILFPESFKHSEFRRFDPISAGFVGIEIRYDGEKSFLRVFGKSESLKMEPDCNDVFLIERAFQEVSF